MNIRFVFYSYIVISFFQLVNCWSGKIVFNDEFDGEKLDTNKWTVEKNCAPYNNELQCYTNRSQNIRVSDGRLIIEARPEKYESKNYTSARITQKSNIKAYGAFVFRAKLPNGAFLWPAFWTLFSNRCKYEEIDIIEYRGQSTNMTSFAAHYGRVWNLIKSKGSHKIFPNTDLSAEFHEFALLWLEKSLQWYVDRVKYFEVSTEEANWVNNKNRPCPSANQKPFSEASPMILNVAIGGSFFPEKVYGTLTPEIAKKWQSPKLEVDWVRIYQD